MIITVGNMWDELGVADLILFTANSVITRGGRLVMGAGAALEAKNRYPWLSYYLANEIKKFPDPDRYGVAIYDRKVYKDTRIGAFQTKEDWKRNSRLDLIETAVEKVKLLVPEYPRIVINFPGINHGRLTEQQVLPVIRSLPDSVIFYKKEQAE